MTYAIHPVIPTRSDPCRGLNIPIVDIKINVFRDRLSGFGLMSDTPVIKRQIQKRLELPTIMGPDQRQMLT